MLPITFGLLICLASLSDEVRIPACVSSDRVSSVRVPSVSLPSISLQYNQDAPSTANAENQLEQEVTLRLPSSRGSSISLPSIKYSLQGAPSIANAENQLEQEVTLRLPSSRGPQVSLPSIKYSLQGAPSTANAENQLEQEWLNFKLKYNKIYPSLEEEAVRKEVFLENREKVLRYSIEYAQGLKNFVSRINTYADILHHEFTERFNGFNRSRPVAATSGSRRHFPSSFIPSANVDFPESIDWRTVGAVGPVKNQGKNCLSCFAFAAAGALESQWFRKTGQLVDVSVQNLLDCSEPQGNFGCRGGFISSAFEYVKENGGVDSEPSYAYEAKTDQCRFTPENIVATCTG